VVPGKTVDSETSGGVPPDSSLGESHTLYQKSDIFVLRSLGADGQTKFPPEYAPNEFGGVANLDELKNHKYFNILRETTGPSFNLPPAGPGFASAGLSRF
jgi:hypothetical protein